jgi:hypothetical protein
VSTQLLGRPHGRKPDKGPGIAHIRDWQAFEATGEIKGLCGKKLKGLPAAGYPDRCVVCLSLDNNRRRRVR